MLRAVREVAKGKSAGENLIIVELLQFKMCIVWLHRVILATWMGEKAPQDWQKGIVIYHCTKGKRSNAVLLCKKRKSIGERLIGPRRQSRSCSSVVRKRNLFNESRGHGS